MLTFVNYLQHCGLYRSSHIRGWPQQQSLPVALSSLVFFVFFYQWCSAWIHFDVQLVFSHFPLCPYSLNLFFFTRFTHSTVYAIFLPHVSFRNFHTHPCFDGRELKLILVYYVCLQWILIWISIHRLRYYLNGRAGPVTCVVSCQ